MRPTGALYLLAVTPLWVTVLVLYFATIGVLWLIRERFEGLGYNVALSSQLGDVFLIGVILIAVELLQLQTRTLLISGAAQMFLVVVAIIFGLIWWIADRPAQWADWYHHLVVAPLFVFLLVLSALVILWNGDTMRIAVAALLLVGWAGLVVYDFETGRIDQQAWLAKQGIVLKK